MIIYHFHCLFDYCYYVQAPDVTAAAPRPGRLGLGAKFIPHSAALNTRDTGADGENTFYHTEQL